ncbi:MAG: DUF4221 family protein [Bacteroidales bacterium]|jgi:hypothetical protein|nr:DUF4221 family protein [Bacteroidales bacterium]
MPKIVTSICVFVLLFFVSCKNRENALQDNSYAEEITVKNEEFVVHTQDELFLKDYNLVSSFACDSSLDIIVAYNHTIHALDLFSPQSNYLKQVILDKEGGNGILPDIHGLYVHTLDSIWIYNYDIVYLTDTTGIVKEKIDIGNLQSDEEIIIHANYSISSAYLYYNKKRNSLFYAARIIQPNYKLRFYVYEYFLENRNVKQYELSGSDYDTDIWSSYGWKNTPNVTFSDDKIVYNYPIESNIYTIDLEDNSKHTYGGKSRYTKNTVNKLSGNAGFFSAEIHKIENVHFYEIVYNPVLDLYFRLHIDRNDFLKTQDAQDAGIQFNKKGRYLMIFNSKFEIVYEGKLPSDRYSVITSWCAVNKGFLMFVNNYYFNGSGINENTVLFDVFEPQI